MSIYSLKCTKDSSYFGIYAGVGTNPFVGKSAIIIKCAQHYAKDNHKSIFTYILYRIHQCALAIINKSDWQIARHYLMKNLKSANDRNRIVNFDEVNNSVKRNCIVDGILSSFVSVYNQDNNGQFLDLKIIEKKIIFLCADYKKQFQTKDSPFAKMFMKVVEWGFTHNWDSIVFF